MNLVCFCSFQATKKSQSISKITLEHDPIHYILEIHCHSTSENPDEYFFSGIEHLMKFKATYLRKITHGLITELASTASPD